MGSVLVALVPLPTLASTAPTAAPQSQAFRSAEIDDKLEVQGDALSVSRAASRMYLNVKVDGQGPFQFVVDSGADRTVVGASVAAKLSLPPEEPVILNSISGRQVVNTVRLNHLEVGDTIVKGISAPALPEAFLDAQGIVGIDALADQRLMLDFEKNTVTIQNSAARQARVPGEVVVTARRRHGQLLLTEVRLNGVFLSAIIDTRSDLTIGNRALLARLLHARKSPDARPTLITSVTGQSIMADEFVIRDLQIGPLDVDELNVAFADVTPFEVFGLSHQPALLLGTDALKGFRRVSLDFEHRKVRFQLRPSSKSQAMDCRKIDTCRPRN